jgi:antitoxin component of RelBE/YafQ-DinJ toxin-antitoxin module
MTTLTVRIEEHLKNRASERARRMGIPVTLIVTNALRDFANGNKVILSDPEDVPVTSKIQKKMNAVAELLRTSKR